MSAEVFLPHVNPPASGPDDRVCVCGHGYSEDHAASRFDRIECYTVGRGPRGGWVRCPCREFVCAEHGSEDCFGDTDRAGGRG